MYMHNKEDNSLVPKEEEIAETDPEEASSGEKESNHNPTIEKMKMDDYTKPAFSSDAPVSAEKSTSSSSSSVNPTVAEKEAIAAKPKEKTNTPAAIEPAKASSSNISEGDSEMKNKGIKSSEDTIAVAIAETVPAVAGGPSATAPTTKSKATKTTTSTALLSKASSSEKPPPYLGMKNPAAIGAPTGSSASAIRKKKQEKGKKQGKKRKAVEGSGTTNRRGSNDSSQLGDDPGGPKKPGPRKGKKKKKNDRDAEIVGKKVTSSKGQDSTTGGKVKKSKKGKLNTQKYSPAQAAVQDLMRNILEEEKYSQKGSIVETESSDDEDDERTIYAIASGAASSSKRGTYGADATISMLRLDRATITKAMRKRLLIEELRGAMETSGANKKRANSVVLVEDNNDNGRGGDDGKGGDVESGRGGRKKKRKKAKRNVRNGGPEDGIAIGGESEEFGFGKESQYDGNEGDMGADESSIFGQTAGSSSNSIWVECDKCKKWRRLKGLVDAKRLPLKWYCSMNKTDPERARCSAPEEEYEQSNTPENVTDQRTRKHLRLWVRRLQCNEKFESRLPTMTRGKRRNTATSSKEPYEWVRCCNPSCGKWRSLLKSMDASSVIEAANNGEWYCVLNTWDEKTASCAAPQENLPAIGCPAWVRTES